jgi:hypothetical protein
MACPACGCKVHYQFNSEEGFAGDDERLERCAACGAVFDIEDAADDDDDEHPAADALRWAGFGPEDNRAMGDGLQPSAASASSSETGQEQSRGGEG